MKKIFLLITVVLLSLSLISCKKNKENVIVVGASSTPHAKILEQAKPMLEELGYKLEIKIIDDYKIPNAFLHQGSIDANYFQHLPFLNSYNKDNGTNLVSIGAIHYEPFGLYGNEITDLGQATKQILIPNDGSNRSRALLLLEQAGLIILRSGIDPTGEITQKDIVNLNGFEITELAAENIASSLRFSEKGTLGVVNGNYALSSGLNVADALATVAIFIFSVIFDNSSMYDAYWSVQPIVIVLAFFIVSPITIYSILALIAVLVWGIRLTVNWIYTFDNLKWEDWRYKMYREKMGKLYWPVSFLGIHMVPTLVVYGAIIPVVYGIIACPESNAATYIFFVLAILSAVLQGTADIQMHKYRKNRVRN